MVAGPSGVGKTSVVTGLARVLPFHFSVSVTTRPRRPGEVEGADYFFVDDDEFRCMIDGGDFLEWAHYNRHYYGTPRRAVEEWLAAGEDVVLDIEVQGARQIREARPEAILFFILPPSLSVLRERLRRRGDTDDADVERRLEIARQEIELSESVFDHVIVNDEVEHVVSELLGILQRPKEPPT